MHHMLDQVAPYVGALAFAHDAPHQCQRWQGRGRGRDEVGIVTHAAIAAVGTQLTIISCGARATVLAFAVFKGRALVRAEVGWGRRRYWREAESRSAVVTVGAHVAVGAHTADTTVLTHTVSVGWACI